MNKKSSPKQASSSYFPKLVPVETVHSTVAAKPIPFPEYSPTSNINKSFSKGRRTSKKTLSTSKQFHDFFKGLTLEELERLQKNMTKYYESANNGTSNGEKEPLATNGTTDVAKNKMFHAIHSPVSSFGSESTMSPEVFGETHFDNSPPSDVWTLAAPPDLETFLDLNLLESETK